MTRTNGGFKSPLSLSAYWELGVFSALRELIYSVMYTLAYLMEHSREFVVFHIADAVKPKQMEVRCGYSVARPHR